MDKIETRESCIVRFAKETNNEAKLDPKFYNYTRKGFDLASYAVGWMDGILERPETTMEDVRKFHADYSEARRILREE